MDIVAEDLLIDGVGKDIVVQDEFTTYVGEVLSVREEEDAIVAPVWTKYNQVMVLILDKDKPVTILEMNY